MNVNLRGERKHRPFGIQYFQVSLAIICVSREQIFAVRDDWLLGFSIHEQREQHIKRKGRQSSQIFSLSAVRDVRNFFGSTQREVRATPEIRNKLTDSRRSLLTRARLTTQGKKGYPSSKHQFVTHSITNIRSSTNSYEESTRKVYFHEILKTEKLLLIRPGEDKTKKKTKVKSKEGLMRLKLQIPLLFPWNIFDDVD